MGNLRLFSLWQPWATLFATPDPEYPKRALKACETRHWHPSRYRVEFPCRVAIHAAKKWGPDFRSLIQSEPFCSILRSLGVCTSATEPLPLGKIIGVTTLVSAAPSHEVMRRLSAQPVWSGITERERAFGDWSDGRFGILGKDPMLLPEPIPFRARQEPLFVLDDATQALIDEQLAAPAAPHPETTDRE